MQQLYIECVTVAIVTISDGSAPIRLPSRSVEPSRDDIIFRCNWSSSCFSLFVCSSIGAVFFFSSKYFFFHTSRAVINENLG